MAESTPVGEFAAWLPGELVYSVSKAGYDKKIGRARLPLDDGQSMYVFLGGEWYAHRLLRDRGKQYSPNHEKSAQLQLAKFAAGLFDKVSLGNWLLAGTPATQENFVAAAEQTGIEIATSLPVSWDKDAGEVLDKKFEDTPFAPGIETIMRGIALASELNGKARQEVIESFQLIATGLGHMATAAYQHYALGHLTPEQYKLPISEL